MALVDREGLMVELVDVAEWARPFADFELPVPSARRYEAHNRATLCGGHVCLVLTPNGEIKIFADGAQVFSFLATGTLAFDGRRREVSQESGKAGAGEQGFGAPAVFRSRSILRREGVEDCLSSSTIGGKHGNWWVIAICFISNTIRRKPDQRISSTICCAASA